MLLLLSFFFLPVFRLESLKVLVHFIDVLATPIGRWKVVAGVGDIREFNCHGTAGSIEDANGIVI
jgi:hypothetical protein